MICCPSPIRAASISVVRNGTTEIIAPREGCEFVIGSPTTFEMTLDLAPAHRGFWRMAMLATQADRLDFALWLSERGFPPMAACDLVDAVAEGRWPR